MAALGNCSGPRVHKALVDKARALEPGHLWSHYRAMAIALRTHKAPEVADHLATLLRSPGFGGHHQHYGTGKDIASRKNVDRSKVEASKLNSALRELTTAGMLYRVGDHAGLGRSVLDNYRNEVGGHLARYAEAFLSAGR